MRHRHSTPNRWGTYAAVVVLGTGLSGIVATASCNSGGECTDTLPLGSYAHSCEGCEMRGSVRACSCGDGHAHMLDTQLDTCSCATSDSIANCWGKLQCTECACIPSGNACGPSDSDVAACCSGHCGSHGTCD